MKPTKAEMQALVREAAHIVIEALRVPTRPADYRSEFDESDKFFSTTTSIEQSFFVGTDEMDDPQDEE